MDYLIYFLPFLIFWLYVAHKTSNKIFLLKITGISLLSANVPFMLFGMFMGLPSILLATAIVTWLKDKNLI